MKDWSKAEKAVYKYFSEEKGSFIYRFSDTHDVNAQLKRFGENKKMVFTEKKPSDFLVVFHGRMFFAEVKSTENVKGVTSSLFKEQVGLRNRIVKASGAYFYFIYSIFNKKWYVVPAFEIMSNPNRKWEQLKYYEVDYLCEI